MNIIKNIKNIQNDNYSKNSSHILVDYAYENDIVKLIPNIKNALVTKINCKTSWNLLYESKLIILDFTMDKNYNYYFTGYFNKNIQIDEYTEAKISEDGYTDVFVAKMTHGDITKIKFVPGLKNDKAHRIQVDTHGDIYICGYFTDSITFGTIYLTAESDNKNAFVAKINGKYWEWIWANSAGKIGFDAEYKFIEIMNNDLYLIGHFNKEITFNTIPKTEIITNGKNIILVKINPYNGDFKWIKNTNSNDCIKAKDVKIKNKKIYICGNLKGEIVFNENNVIKTENDRGFISCFNLKGKCLWAKNCNEANSFVEKMKIDNLDNIYILGHYLSINNEKNRAYILKINNYHTAWIYNMKASENIKLYDLEIDIHNHFYISGSFTGEMTLQNKTYTGINQTFIMKLSDNNYLISFILCDTKFDNLKLYNYQGLHLGGMVKDDYNLIKYSFDERSEKCLGIVRTPGLSENGNNIDIEFPGNISTGYKNLKPGYDYFIQDNGEIDTYYNEYYFGTAIAVDKLLLK